MAVTIGSLLQLFEQGNVSRKLGYGRNDDTVKVSWERGYGWSVLGMKLWLECPGNEAMVGVSWE